MKRLQSIYDAKERRWDRVEFWIQVALFLIALVLILRVEILDEQLESEISHYEVGVRHALPPLELK